MTLTQYVLIPRVTLYCYDSLSTYLHAMPDLVLLINEVSNLCMNYSELCAFEMMNAFRFGSLEILPCRW
jgi:hypothetical protein